MPISPVQAAEHRYRINRILNNGATQRSRKLSLWNYILTAELAHGTQFIVTKPDGQLYVVLGATNEIVSIPRPSRGGDRWFSYVQTLYGLAEREDESKFVYDVLRAYTLQYGIRVPLRRFSVYDRTGQTAYLSGYNGRMFKIEGSATISEIAVGEDGIFFADDDPGEHVDPDIGDHGMFLQRLTNLNFTPAGLSGITPEQQKMAMTIWIFALAFPDLMPCKPLLLIEGPQGAGKTTAIQLLQLALMGISRPIIIQRNKEDDFGVVLLRAPIALFDNQDTYIDWIPDAVCSYTTTGCWTKRKLYTDDESMTIKPHAFIAVASKNPVSYRREDTVDRSIVLRLERRNDFTSPAQLEEEMALLRPQLLGEYMWLVGRIVDEMRADTASGTVAPAETHRMADFGRLGRVVGRVLGWEPEAIAELMRALQKERDAFANEEDPLVDVIGKWLAYQPKNGVRNIGRLMMINQLHTELESMAQASGIPWKHTPRTLSQKIRSPHIEREFRIEASVVGGHKAYQIWRVTDARLRIVSDDDEAPIPIIEEES